MQIARRYPPTRYTFPCMFPYVHPLLQQLQALYMPKLRNANDIQNAQIYRPILVSPSDDRTPSHTNATL